MSNFQVIRRRIRTPVDAITPQARPPLRAIAPQRSTLHLPLGGPQ